MWICMRRSMHLGCVIQYVWSESKKCRMIKANQQAKQNVISYREILAPFFIMIYSSVLLLFLSSLFWLNLRSITLQRAATHSCAPFCCNKSNISSHFSLFLPFTPFSSTVCLWMCLCCCMYACGRAWPNGFWCHKLHVSQLLLTSLSQTRPGAWWRSHDLHRWPGVPAWISHAGKQRAALLQRRAGPHIWAPAHGHGRPEPGGPHQPAQGRHGTEAGCLHGPPEEQVPSPALLTTLSIPLAWQHEGYCREKRTWTGMYEAYLVYCYWINVIVSHVTTFWFTNHIPGLGLGRGQETIFFVLVRAMDFNLIL